MNSLKAHAFRLRLSGKSYNEIQKEIGVSKSTLSGWFKHVVLSASAQKRLSSRSGIGTAVLVKRNKMQTQEAARRARKMRTEGMRKILPLTKRDVLILGTVLYWAEGYKRLHVRDGKERMSHAISFLNADPVAIKAFIRFAYEVLEVSSDDINLTMRLYPHINEEHARAYWMKVTKLPKSSFKKTTTLVTGASRGKRPFNRLPYGTMQVAVYSTARFHYLMGLIEGVQKKLEA